MRLSDVDFEDLVNAPKFTSDLAFSLNGMTADEYISKVTAEIEGIDVDSVPFDRWDIFVAFSLGMLESTADLFVCDPDFKYSLNDKDGPVVKWMNEHIHGSKWLKHGGQPLDYQGSGYGGGAHRIKSLLHGSPMAYFSYRKKPEDGGALSAASKLYNRALVAHDLIIVVLAITCISLGVFVDIKVTDGRIDPVCEPTNQNGTPYASVNVFVALCKYVIHMFADFFSAEGLVVPGFELLTRVSDSKVAELATRLYDKGMNLRTMTLQSCVAFAIDKLMQLYVGMRTLTDEHSQAAILHKTNKLLLIGHGICAAINVGKAVVTESPWRLNLVVITRTVQLVWKVVAGETELTNNHILKLDYQILRSRIESSKTLVLLDELLYETDELNRLTEELHLRMEDSRIVRRKHLDELHSEVSKLDAILED